MARRGSWFFEGYETVIQTDAKGREKKVLVYRGEWYGLEISPAGLSRVKAAMAALSLVLTALFLLLSFRPSPGGMEPWVGAPLLLTLVPLIFLWIGLVNFLVAKPYWEIRTYYAGYRRLGRSALGATVILAVATVAELVFIVTTGRLVVLTESTYLGGLLVCLLCALAIWNIKQRYPAVVIKGPDSE